MDENNNIENNQNIPQDPGDTDVNPVADPTPVPEPISPYNLDSHVPTGEQGKGFSVASLVLGICSILMCCLWYLGLACGILAIIFAFVYKNKNGNMNGLCKAGLVCGIIGTVLGGISALLIMSSGAALSEYLQNYSNLNL